MFAEETVEQPAELKTEEPDKSTVKEESEEVATGKSSSSPVKNSEEVQPPPVKVAPTKFELLDDIADFHAGLQLKSSERIGIVTNVGPYRRALCARRDLAIRRGLCKVEKVCCLDSSIFRDPEVLWSFSAFFVRLSIAKDCH